VIPADDLLAVKLNVPCTVILAGYSGWGAMHGNSPSYSSFKQPLPVPASACGSSKRPRNDSASSSGSWLYQARQPRQDHLPDFTSGGSPGSQSGSCGGKSGLVQLPHLPRSTLRLQHWKVRIRITHQLLQLH
jgi:hypothetical protein